MKTVEEIMREHGLSVKSPKVFAAIVQTRREAVEEVASAIETAERGDGRYRAMNNTDFFAMVARDQLPEDP